MISLLHLNKLTFFTFFFTVLIFSITFAEDEPVDIWEKQENKNEQSNQIDKQEEITIESPILSDSISKITKNIDENKIKDSGLSVIGILDPEENNFNLNMWLDSDGEDIKKF